MLHDHYLVQKLQHFNRERVPDDTDRAGVQVRVIAFWAQVDGTLGARVAAGLRGT